MCVSDILARARAGRTKTRNVTAKCCRAWPLSDFDKIDQALMGGPTMTVLTQEQKDAFWRDGCLVVPDAVSPDLLGALRAEIAGWVEASRAHSMPFGTPTVDGRPRFDMGSEHSPERPALRRINNPSDISDAYLQAMRDSRMTDMVADLIGPDVKFHHCKINLKLTGAKTEVLYHQDFAYTRIPTMMSSPRSCSSTTLTRPMAR